MKLKKFGIGSLQELKSLSPVQRPDDRMEESLSRTLKIKERAFLFQVNIQSNLFPILKSIRFVSQFFVLYS